MQYITEYRGNEYNRFEKMGGGIMLCRGQCISIGKGVEMAADIVRRVGRGVGGERLFEIPFCTMNRSGREGTENGRGFVCTHVWVELE